VRDFGEVPPTITSKGGNEDLHRQPNSYGMVYANDLARKAYFAEAPQVFPLGSIFVREKLSEATSTKPELLAVMIKREKGFNPSAGDWLFLTVSGAATEVKQRTKRGACLECHESAWERDFVFELK
jgi:Cytochrome P460